jgi:two-component system sensor histidine kinase RegB
VRQFLDTLVQNWRATRSVDTFVYDNLPKATAPWWSDATLEQMICNVLDNARDASPHWVLAGAVRCRCVANRGHRPGPRLSAAVLRIGKPYQSTKGGRGGLGLFLW